MVRPTNDNQAGTGAIAAALFMIYFLIVCAMQPLIVWQDHVIVDDGRLKMFAVVHRAVLEIATATTCNNNLARITITRATLHRTSE